MSEKSAAGKITKNKKKIISLERKLDILRRFDKGEKAVEIAKAVGLAATTVRTIRDRDGDKIREAAKSATSLDAKKMARTRSALMIKMESLLSIWIENQVAHKIPLSKMVIQTKAKSLFDDLKIKAAVSHNASGSKDNKETFEASQGWFERFKLRANLHSIALKGGVQQFAVCHEVSNLARESNIEDMKESDINELLISHNQEFSNEELLQLELPCANEEGDNSIKISGKQKLTSKEISKALCLIDDAMEIFLKNDPDNERSLKVSQEVDRTINCYKEIYSTLKKKAVQQTLDQFVLKKSIMDSSEF